MPSSGIAGRALGPLAAAGMTLLVFALVQSAALHPVGVDGLFHIQSANLIRENLPKPWISDFHWLEHTSLRHDRFADFYWGFHLVLLPFTVLPLEAAAKLAPVLLASLSLMALYFVLGRLGVRARLFWLCLALLSSPIFLMRLSQNKAPTVMLGLVLLLVWSLTEGRHRLAALFSALATWVYPVLPLLYPLGLCAIGARGVVRRRVPWRGLLALVAGSAAGLLLHPDFPKNLAFSVVNITEAMSLRAGEFRALRADVLLGDVWALLLVYLLAFRYAVFRRDHPRSVAAWGLLLASTLLIGLTVRHMRGIDFLPPFVVLFGALVLDEPLRRWFERARANAATVPAKAAWAGSLALVIVVAAGIQVTRARQVVVRNSSAVPHRLEAAARWLAANTRPGELVLNLSAGDFEQLWLYNTHNTYFVGFNVNFLQRESPGLFQEYARVYERGDLEALRRLVTRHTEARYVLASDRLPPRLLSQIESSALFETVYSDRSCRILAARR